MSSIPQTFMEDLDEVYAQLASYNNEKARQIKEAADSIDEDESSSASISAPDESASSMIDQFRAYMLNKVSKSTLTIRELLAEVRGFCLSKGITAKESALKLISNILRRLRLERSTTPPSSLNLKLPKLDDFIILVVQQSSTQSACSNVDTASIKERSLPITDISEDSCSESLGKSSSKVDKSKEDTSSVEDIPSLTEEQKKEMDEERYATNWILHLENYEPPAYPPPEQSSESVESLILSSNSDTGWSICTSALQDSTEGLNSLDESAGTSKEQIGSKK